MSAIAYFMSAIFLGLLGMLGGFCIERKFVRISVMVASLLFFVHGVAVVKILVIPTVAYNEGSLKIGLTVKGRPTDMDSPHFSDYIPYPIWSAKRHMEKSEVQYKEAVEVLGENDAEFELAALEEAKKHYKDISREWELGKIEKEREKILARRQELVEKQKWAKQ